MKDGIILNGLKNITLIYMHTHTHLAFIRWYMSLGHFHLKPWFMHSYTFALYSVFLEKTGQVLKRIHHADSSILWGPRELQFSFWEQERYLVFWCWDKRPPGSKLNLLKVIKHHRLWKTDILFECMLAQEPPPPPLTKGQWSVLQ